MFIKIFHGSSQKYLLLQSNKITLDKTPRTVVSESYYILCAFLRAHSYPVDETPFELFNHLSEKFSRVNGSYTEKCDDNVTLSGAISKLYPNVDWGNLVPVLSDEEERRVLKNMNIHEADSEPEWVANHQLAVVEVDGKTYFTTGNIFITNDEGKTVDRV